ncbi:uncharacterized protein EI97DRAFT_434953 [Westerdykella ornata]|uniref:Hemerythrin-like domain-containing protein n=1 Tax=Westerdykella ornata TaxID=318751 RepID=A0A6A6JEK5_WESOR|nr:uncharacterized protein EI97DRAFT_434953 [Westerdykella ornata]KAF2274727.1 hypothetical protein EI97DRAFT_434953 [Westerdykella ornata]
MALVHNIIIRSLNSIYLQAPHVPPSHQSAFTCYMLATWQTVHEHHRGEETSLFPAIEKATGETGIMEVNVRQHQAFETGFEAWGHWIRDVEQERERFSGQRCRDLMDGFMRDLATHLAEEIPSLMALAKYPESRLPLRRLWEEEGKAVMGGLSKTRQLPVVLLNHDVTFEGEGLHANFPPLPAPVKWVLMNVCARWNASWWAFSTCGVDGRPRELAFLGE